MLSVPNMLVDNACHKESYTKPSVLDISFLLCPKEERDDASIWQKQQDAYVQMIWTRHDGIKGSSSPCYLLNKKSSRQHRIESKKIEQELSIRRQSYSSVDSSCSSNDYDREILPLKAKRRRASSQQLQALNKVFDRTFFPSTQLRAELGRQLGMSPRTVQIWFQNKRQSIRAKEQSNNNSSRENSLSPE